MTMYRLVLGNEKDTVYFKFYQLAILNLTMGQNVEQQYKTTGLNSAK